MRRRAPTPVETADRVPAGSTEPTGATRSLIEDLERLVDDAQTYFNAELTYQKSRAAFILDRVKKTVIFAVAAGVIGFLAAIGLTVGLIIALTPLITGFGATALVVGVMLLVAYLLIRRALTNWQDVSRVAKDKQPQAANDHSGGGSNG